MEGYDVKDDSDKNQLWRSYKVLSHSGSRNFKETQVKKTVLMMLYLTMSFLHLTQLQMFTKIRTFQYLKVFFSHHQMRNRCCLIRRPHLTAIIILLSSLPHWLQPRTGVLKMIAYLARLGYLIVIILGTLSAAKILNSMIALLKDLLSNPI